LSELYLNCTCVLWPLHHHSLLSQKCCKGLYHKQQSVNIRKLIRCWEFLAQWYVVRNFSDFCANFSWYKLFLYPRNTHFIFILHYTTGCRILVVVLSLSKRKVVSSSPARAGRVKPKTFKIGSDCFFAKSTAFRR
jgi:hypothetical protein